MRKRVQSFFNREYLITLGPAILIAIAGFWVAYQFVQPAPPHTIVISTGSKDGAYYAFAQQYRQVLARDKISLEIKTSAGSLENIGRLQAKEGRIDLAFVQSGTREGQNSQALESLGSLYYEPLWVAHRHRLKVNRLTDLRGKRIAVGAIGSGTRVIALRLLAGNAVTRAPTVILDVGGQAAVDGLRRGTIDAAFIIAGAKSPVVRKLAQTRGVQLMSFERADAYTRIHPYLSKVILPQGVVDLEKNLPVSDKVLLAATANLVVRADLHPALVDLLLQAASEIHGRGGLFERVGEFPSPLHVEFPLSKEAARYYKRGRSFLRRYLPFWVATFVDRAIVMLVPIVALLIPLSRIVPPAYRWQIRRKIYRRYKDIKAVDTALRAKLSVDELDSYERELDKIEDEVKSISTPLSYADQLYDLRVHIDLVRRKLEKAKQDVAMEEGG
ncbi:MAG: TAXI family TRAP transporter solute-binding subunit [Acidiferrobacterales bacterium]